MCLQSHCGCWLEQKAGTATKPAFVGAARSEIVTAFVLSNQLYSKLNKRSQQLIKFTICIHTDAKHVSYNHLLLIFIYNFYNALDRDLAAASTQNTITDRCCFTCAHRTGCWASDWLPIVSSKSVRPEKSELAQLSLELGEKTTWLPEEQRAVFSQTFNCCHLKLFTCRSSGQVNREGR